MSAREECTGRCDVTNTDRSPRTLPRAQKPLRRSGPTRRSAHLATRGCHHPTGRGGRRGCTTEKCDGAFSAQGGVWPLTRGRRSRLSNGPDHGIRSTSWSVPGSSGRGCPACPPRMELDPMRRCHCGNCWLPKSVRDGRMGHGSESVAAALTSCRKTRGLSDERVVRRRLRSGCENPSISGRGLHQVVVQPSGRTVARVSTGQQSLVGPSSVGTGVRNNPDPGSRRLGVVPS